MSNLAQSLILLDLPDELVGERVLVRGYRPGDGSALWEAIEESRDHLWPWMPWVPEHRTSQDSEAFARRAHGEWLKRENFVAGVWERETGRLLGGTGLHPTDLSVPSFEVGYWLRPSAEGHGFMSEAIRLLCGLAFDTLGANRLHLRCDARNQRSAAVARRVGFIHEGTRRHDSRNHATGELRDTECFSLLPRELRFSRPE